MTAGFNFNNYAAGFCSATPALRGNRGFLSGRSQTSEWKASRISKETAMALYIDISAIAGQVRIIRAVTKRYAPLLQKVSGECTEDIVNDFVIKLRGLIFSYKVTTIFADGSRETVRALRFKGCVKDFATTFWARKLDCIHNQFPLE